MSYNGLGITGPGGIICIGALENGSAVRVNVPRDRSESDLSITVSPIVVRPVPMCQWMTV